MQQWPGLLLVQSGVLRWVPAVRPHVGAAADRPVRSRLQGYDQRPDAPVGESERHCGVTPGHLPAQPMEGSWICPHRGSVRVGGWHAMGPRCARGRRLRQHVLCAPWDERDVAAAHADRDHVEDRWQRHRDMECSEQPWRRILVPLVPGHRDPVGGVLPEAPARFCARPAGDPLPGRVAQIHSGHVCRRRDLPTRLDVGHAAHPPGRTWAAVPSRAQRHQLNPERLHAVGGAQ
mmetsp:Transcript_19164/g.49792  ORF Transcript_19164/g.49792 Transcript_19164/m.49792 type:complete len:233 (+) Transcript_19164:124-822(+)